MRCYKVEAPGCVRLAPTGGEARAYRQAMVEERDIKKKDVDINPVELKTAKPELLSFLNGLLEYLDDKEDFEMPEELSVVDKAAQKAAREAKKKAKPRTTLGEGTPELTKLVEEKTGTKKTTPVKKPASKKAAPVKKAPAKKPVKKAPAKKLVKKGKR